jgi:hypothetical protein
MNPLPFEEPLFSHPSVLDPGSPGLAGGAAAYPAMNKRSSSPLSRVYPLLFAVSTAVAGIFCTLYITKPVIIAGERGLERDATPPRPAHVEEDDRLPPALVPSTDRLPGDSARGAGIEHIAAARPLPPPPSSGSPFEETNLRVQHVLTAETPDGHQSRIVLDVPVLYESRQLRWTAAETLEARELLNRLAAHQERTLALRSEGMELLDAWNALVARGIPASELRADSPTLPENQQDASSKPRPVSLDSTEIIRVETPTEK